MNDSIIWFNRICIWIYRLAYLNILWILFTLLGLGILGIYPATAAVFVIVRKWNIYEEPPIFKTFWTSYKKDFVKVNFLGYILLLIGLFLFLDLRFFQASDSSILMYLSYIYFPMIVLYLITTLYVFPVYTNYELKIIHVIKNAFLLAIGNLLTTLFMIVSSSLVWYIVYSIPIFMIFFSITPVAYIIMWFANMTFSRYEQTQQINLHQ